MHDLLRRNGKDGCCYFLKFLNQNLSISENHSVFIDRFICEMHEKCPEVIKLDLISKCRLHIVKSPEYVFLRISNVSPKFILIKLVHGESY